MISVLQQAIVSIQLKNYMSLVVITAIGYDYILVFSDEIEFIWNKPWTWISTLFVLARYSGLCSTICYALCAFKLGFEFVDLTQPDQRGFFFPFWPCKGDCAYFNRCSIIGILGGCCFWIFTCSADLVMTLRLWALYNRSRLILGTLFVFYATEAISSFVFYVLTTAQNRHGPAAGNARVLKLSFCVWEHLSTTWSIVLYVFGIIFSALICLLIAVKSGKELLQTYRATKRFQLNRYRKLLAWEGTMYFTVILGFSILDLLSFAGIRPTVKGQTILAVVLQLQIPPIALIPRFIISLRKLYLRDAQGRRTSDIDTAFGLTSGCSTTMSTIVFGDVGPQNENDEEGDETEMEEMKGQIYGASIRA